jgi:hypothetical protein
VKAQAQIGRPLPFDLADLRQLSLADAKATLRRFQWLLEFSIAAPGTATEEEGRLLLRSIEVLEEMIDEAKG